MRMQRYYMPTLREVPAEAEIPSHQLLLRAGMIRKAASGIYAFLPLGFRVLEKIERIVREEMDAADAQEIKMSILQPKEIWEESGRWNTYGPEMFKVTDRSERTFCLGPTAEEYFTSLIKDEVRSYKQLPLNIYQIQWKYRDEKRPRFGINRSREFLMKDAYTFDADVDGMKSSYQNMWDAYVKMFDRIGLDYRIVRGDSGAMGGNESHEFIALSDIGEGVIAYCDSCDYAATDEKAKVFLGAEREGLPDLGDLTEEDLEPIEVDPNAPAMCPGESLCAMEIETPNKRTIEEVSSFLQASPEKLIKAVLLNVAGDPVMVLVPGDRELNMTKLVGYLGVPEHEIEMMSDEEIESLTGAKPGFSGPVGLKKDARIIVDRRVTVGEDHICGANKNDTHLYNVGYGKDFQGEVVADLLMVKEGDVCPECGGKLTFARGIEVGNIFQLGTKYSGTMHASFLDVNGKEQPFQMGSYGVGITRAISAVVEQNHDDKGIIWPLSVAPFHCIVTIVNTKSDEQVALGESIYRELQDAGVQVLFDDRKERAGVKFNDRDLIGIPYRITVGKKAGEGIVEYSTRREMENQERTAEETVNSIRNALRENRFIQ